MNNENKTNIKPTSVLGLLDTGFNRASLLRRRSALNSRELPQALPQATFAPASGSSAQKPARRPARAIELTQTFEDGVVHLNHRGFGFATRPTGEAYYIASNLTRGLVTGDRISFRATVGDDSEVKRISKVARVASLQLCEVAELAGVRTLVPDDQVGVALLAPEAELSKIEPGCVVAVQIPAYEGEVQAQPVPVAVLHDLGERTREGFDLDYALMRYNLHEPMPQSLQALELEGAGPGEVYSTPFVTIDGESTRDIDDAVFARRQSDGSFQVEVAIADVSWYVKPGTELDSWAASRCTSVYLPGRTVPMLPESLSNQQCSLLPGVQRRAVVLSLELSPDGEVLQSSVRRGFIVSAARLTYNQVAAYLQGDAGALPDAIKSNIDVLNEVYRLQAKRRAERGCLEFEEPEPTMVQDATGAWTLKWEHRNDAHKLVEELMLLANRVAAETLMRRYGFALVRHQPAPEDADWAELGEWALARGHKLAAAPSLPAMASLIASQATPETQTAAVMRVRSTMRPAKYALLDSTVDGRHFSLSVGLYTHFTSPIRRYADLLVHRLLLAPVDYVLSAEAREVLNQQAYFCNDRSKAARMAERFMWDRLKLDGFLTATPTAKVIPVRVMRSMPRGLRVILPEWQISAWLAGAALRRAGFTETDGVWTQPDGRKVEDGSMLQVTWAQVNLERPAYPELQVIPAPVELPQAA